MKFEKHIQEHTARTSKALQMGGQQRLEKQYALGRMDARQRLDYLLDPDTFEEIGMFAREEARSEWEHTPADGKICGYGKINGREAAVVSHDITVKSASSSRINVRKMSHMRRSAVANGIPFVLLNESTGARMPETMGAIGTGSLGQDPTQFVRMREINYVSAVLGPAFGTAGWFTQLSDYVVMRKDAYLSIVSPKVTSIAINKDVDAQEMAGWRMQTEVTGKVDHVVDTDEEALDLVKKFLSYMPSHHNELPPRLDPPANSIDVSDEILQLLPEARSQVYDVRKIVALIADKDSLFPLKDRFARTAYTALGRINGQVVGFAASNPLYKAGALDPNACDKITSFLILCDSFNIPIILLADTPGFLIGPEGERNKAPGKIMNFMSALQMCTVPKFSIVLRKSYGQAYLNMGGTRNSDEMAAWFTADVGFMDPNVGVNVIHGVRYEDDPARFKSLVDELSRETSAYDLAGIFAAQVVLDPRNTRLWLSRMLDVHRRRLTNGIGKHLLCGWPTTL